MTSRDFVFFLNGFLEISKAQTLNKEQVALIRAHLHLVFKHEIAPSYGDESHQAALAEIHEAGHGHEAETEIDKSAVPGHDSKVTLPDGKVVPATPERLTPDPKVADALRKFLEEREKEERIGRRRGINWGRGTLIC